MGKHAWLGVLAVAALAGCQGQPIFEPDRSLRVGPGDFPFAVEEVHIPVRGADGEPQELNAWWIPSRRHRRTAVLYLHGNDGNLGTNIDEVEPLRSLGYSVLMIDYRGFGRSHPMRPTEASVYEDAGAAWRYLVEARGYRPGRVFIYGHSLGGAIAIELARLHPEAAGLVVESSFTSIYDMAMLDKLYRLLPLRPFLTQFDSLGKVASLKLPVLFLHGTADEVVPFSMGERLYGASGGQKRFVALPGGRHEHGPQPEGAPLREALREFLRNVSGPPRRRRASRGSRSWRGAPASPRRAGGGGPCR